MLFNDTMKIFQSFVTIERIRPGINYRFHLHSRTFNMESIHYGHFMDKIK